MKRKVEAITIERKLLSHFLRFVSPIPQTDIRTLLDPVSQRHQGLIQAL
jgi:hypothetical protein